MVTSTMVTSTIMDKSHKNNVERKKQVTKICSVSYHLYKVHKMKTKEYIVREMHMYGETMQDSEGIISTKFKTIQEVERDKQSESFSRKYPAF